MSTTPVTVIIVSYNTRELTMAALAALFRSSVQPKEVIVVDNASSDDTVNSIREKFPSVQLIVNSANVGYAAVNNQGIDASTEPYVWLLNSDTETGARTLEQLVVYMETHEKVAALGPMLVYPGGAHQSVGGYFPTFLNVLYYLFPFVKLFPQSVQKRLHSIALYQQSVPPEGLHLDYVTGAALMLRRSALQAVGRLPENYFMYFEETDLCFRLARAGWERVVIPTDPVMHVYGGSYRTAYDAKRLKQFLKSLILFVRTFYKGPKRIVIVTLVAVFGSLSVWLKRLKNI